MFSLANAWRAFLKAQKRRVNATQAYTVLIHLEPNEKICTTSESVRRDISHCEKLLLATEKCGHCSAVPKKVETPRKHHLGFNPKERTPNLVSLPSLLRLSSSPRQRLTRQRDALASDPGFDLCLLWKWMNEKRMSWMMNLIDWMVWIVNGLIGWERRLQIPHEFQIPHSTKTALETRACGRSK